MEIRHRSWGSSEQGEMMELLNKQEHFLPFFTMVQGICPHQLTCEGICSQHRSLSEVSVSITWIRAHHATEDTLFLFPSAGTSQLAAQEPFALPRIEKISGMGGWCSSAFSSASFSSLYREDHSPYLFFVSLKQELLCVF